MKFGALTVSILILSLARASALAASPEDVLKGAWEDPSVKASKQALEIVAEGRSYNPIKQTQLRVERGEIQNEDLEYALRAYPKGFTEFSKSKTYQKSLERSEQALSRGALSQTLATRYLLLARTALLKSKLDLANQLTDLNSRSGKAAAYAAQRDRTELKSFLKSKTDLDKLDLKLAEIRRDYATLEDDFKSRALSDPKSLDLSDLIAPTDIVSRLGGGEVPGETLSGQVARLEAEKADAAVEYERSQNESWVDHVELSMKNAKNNEQVYGVRVSFNLPFFSAPDMGDIDKSAKFAREKAEQLQIARDSSALLRNSVSELKTLLELHKKLTGERTRMSPAQMRKASQSVAARDPLLAIEFQRGWYESFEQLLDVEFRIRELYVGYLLESSTIASAPEVNHFSKSKKRIM